MRVSLEAPGDHVRTRLLGLLATELDFESGGVSQDTGATEGLKLGIEGSTRSSTADWLGVVGRRGKRAYVVGSRAAPRGSSLRMSRVALYGDVPPDNPHLATLQTAVGHGLAARRDPNLIEHLRAQHVVLEICPSSNVATGAVLSLAKRPLPALLDAGVPVTLGSDDPPSSTPAFRSPWAATTRPCSAPAC